MRKQFGIANIKRFIFGGNAKFVMHNNISKRMVTFHIKTSKLTPGDLCVFVLDSDKGWVHLWNILPYRPWELRPVDCTLSYAKEYVMANVALEYLLYAVHFHTEIRGDVEVYFGTLCGKCGRKLRGSVNIARGFGKDCWEKVKEEEASATSLNRLLEIYRLNQSRAHFASNSL